MKNGLPSVSRWSACAKCVGGVRPSQAEIIVATSPR